MPPKNIKKKVVKKPKVQVPTPQNPQELEQALVMITTPDTAVIQEGTAILKNFLKNHQSVPPMIDQLNNSQNPQVRQLAGVLLRKFIRTHWKKLGTAMNSMICASLIKRLSEETNVPALSAVTALATHIACVELPKQKFTEILQWTQTATATENPDQVKAALRILRTLVNRIPTTMTPHFPVIRSIFERFATISDKKVRFCALEGLGMLFGAYGTNEQRMTIASAIPALLEVLQAVIRENDDDSAAILFDIFASLTDDDFIDEALPKLFSAVSHVLGVPDMNHSLRDKAVYFITQTIRTKPGRVVKLELSGIALETAFKLLCEECDTPFSDDTSAQRLGYDIFNACMEFLPRPQVFSSSIACVQSFISNPSHYNRKGALVLLAILAEGCADLLVDLEGGKLFPVIVDTVCNLLLTDPHTIVRAAACVCLCHMAEFTTTDIIALHAVVLPALLTTLENPATDALVREKSCLAIDACCEYLETAIVPYLNRLMTQLMTQATSQNPEFVVAAIGAIKSVSISAEKEFLPYFPAVLQHISTYFATDDEEMLPLRARATECLGFIASAIGVENWGGQYEQIIQSVLQGFDIDYFELRETTHTFFANIVQCLGEETPDALLDSVVQLALASLDSDDGIIFDSEDEEGGNVRGFSDSEDEEEKLAKIAASGAAQEDGDDYDDDETGGGMSLRIGALEEKMSALNALAKYLAFNSKTTQKYIENIIDSSSQLVPYPYGPLRREIMVLYGAIYTAVGKLCPMEYVKGKRVELVEKVDQINGALFQDLLEILLSDDHPETVASALETLSTAITTFGMAILPDPALSPAPGTQEEESQYELFVHAILSLAQEKGLCQVDEDRNDITSESGEVVLDALCDFFGYMAKVMGDQFKVLFDQVLPCIIRYCDPQRPDSFRSLAIGSIAECVEYIGEPARVYNEQFFSMSAKLLEDPSIDVRRNTAYLVGTLAMNSLSEAAPYLQSITQLMAPMLVLPSKDSVRSLHSYDGAKDNVISAISKFISTNPSVITVEEFAPVVMNNIPLRSDFLEGRYVYPMVEKFFAMNPNFMMQFVPQVVSAFTEVLIQDTLDDPTGAVIVAFLKNLAQQAGPQVQQIVETLAQSQKDAFMKAMN